MPVPPARRELGRRLKVLRTAAGLTTRQVGTEVGCSQPQISRIEGGTRSCDAPMLDALAVLYGLDEAGTRELKRLSTASADSEDGWWDSYSDVVSASYAEYIQLEDIAEEVVEFQPLVVPGLLQTQRYACAVAAGGLSGVADDRVELLAEVRLTRQARLSTAEPLKSVNILTEAALRFEFGGRSVLQEQLDYLAVLAERPNITVRIVPFATSVFGGHLGGFSIFRFADGSTPTMAVENSLSGNNITEVPRDVGRFERLARRLLRGGLDDAGSLALIRRVREELT